MPSGLESGAAGYFPTGHISKAVDYGLVTDIDARMDVTVIKTAEEEVKNIIFSVDLEPLLAAPRDVTPQNVVIGVSSHP